MPYTPVELRHVRIGRGLLGYKRAAVQDLLTELADSFEKIALQVQCAAEILRGVRESR